ncbi:unnamed protein product [Oikopleura dioica]|uniref:Thymidylate kinase n=1 Tax=Oikopleura dioica TaxID=34765 RepID=E4X489_OIKDI|nr:unnamed protein product [Oikopleura dioica]
MARGALIIFEGVDRSGKSTQIKRIFNQMVNKGENVHLTRFPERTSEIGQTINGYLKSSNDLSDQAIHLLFSANRWEHAQSILNYMNNGTSVLVDRYAFSGVAFTAAKGLDLEWCKNPDRGLPKPDLVLQLDVDEETAKKRGGFGEERYEKVEFQRQVRKLYSQLREEHSDIWKIIDASASVDELTPALQNHVDETIKSCQNKDIEKLWIKRD